MPRRITRTTLEELLDEYCSIAGEPRETWVRQPDGSIHAVVGGLSLDFASHYGGYDLTVQVTQTGAQHSLIGNTIFGSGRMSNKEMAAFLRGMITAEEKLWHSRLEH